MNQQSSRRTMRIARPHALVPDDAGDGFGELAAAGFESRFSPAIVPTIPPTILPVLLSLANRRTCSPTSIRGEQ